MGTYAPVAARALYDTCVTLFEGQRVQVVFNKVMGRAGEDFVIVAETITMNPRWGSIGALQRNDNFEVQCRLGSWRGEQQEAAKLARMDRAYEMLGMIDNELIRQVRDANTVLGINAGLTQNVELTAGDMVGGEDGEKKGFDIQVGFVITCSAKKYTT